jgi:hypothetical protein
MLPVEEPLLMLVRTMKGDMGAVNSTADPRQPKFVVESGKINMACETFTLLVALESLFK